MVRICGVELRSSEAVVVVADLNDGNISHVDLKTRKISLGDDEKTDSIKSFYKSFCNFIRDNHIEVVAIKKRAKKGTRAGGAVSFKLESLIQLCEQAEVELLSPQLIAAANKREKFIVPKALHAYQEQAFLTACCYSRKK